MTTHEDGAKVTGGTPADSTIYGSPAGLFIGSANRLSVQNEDTGITTVTITSNGLDTGSSGNRYATYTILGGRTFNSGHNVTINRSIVNGDVGDPATLAVYEAEFLSMLKHLELERITASFQT